MQARIKNPQERAVEWIYPDGPPSPATIRRDVEVHMLSLRFKRAMIEARQSALYEVAEILEKAVQFLTDIRTRSGLGSSSISRDASLLQKFADDVRALVAK